MASGPLNYACKTLDPDDPDGPKIDAIIPHDVYSRYYKYYRVRYENLRAAKWVLENPLRIFAGIRVFEQGGWCYVGKPLEWYVREDQVEAFPDDKVYCVYLNSRFVVYEWRAAVADTRDVLSPEGWQDRYERLVWKSTS